MKGKMKGINHAANFFACFVMSHGSNIIAHLRINFTISRKNIVLIYLWSICYRGGLNNGLCVPFINFLPFKRIPQYLIKKYSKHLNNYKEGSNCGSNTGIHKYETAIDCSRLGFNALIAIPCIWGLQAGHWIQGGSNKVPQRNKNSCPTKWVS